MTHEVAPIELTARVMDLVQQFDARAEAARKRDQAAYWRATAGQQTDDEHARRDRECAALLEARAADLDRRADDIAADWDRHLNRPPPDHPPGHTSAAADTSRQPV